jgi:ABC-type branched-subunit amino acid transport system substrate-binding protein
VRRSRYFSGAVILAGIVAVVGLPFGGPDASAVVSRAPIVVGGDGTAAVSVGIADGFKAGMLRFNNAGGLNGRKIKFLGFSDDGLSAQTNLTNAQQLVESDHVLAVVPFNSEAAAAATATFLASNKTPFIGYSTNVAFTTEPNWGFGINGDQSNPDVQGVTAMTQILIATGKAKSPGKVKLALIGTNYSGATTANASLAGAAKYKGMNVVYQEAPIPVAGATDYSPYAQAIISSGANSVFEVLAAPEAIGLASALKAANYRGTIVNAVTYYPGQLASQPNEAAALNGIYVDNQFPVNENNSPAVKQAEKDLTAVGVKPYLTQGVSLGYWSAIMFEQMLKATLKAVGNNPDKVTGATLQETIQKGFTYTDS